MIWDRLFEPPYKEKIQKALPTLFNMVELENKRGKKLGMEVGAARERVLIALFMYVYGQNEVEFPPSTSRELDAVVCGNKISIKTKSTKGYSGVKLKWTVDRNKALQFISGFVPQSDLLYIHILWEDMGGLFLIPKKVQQEALEYLGRDKFFKCPKPNTNPRGVELASVAMQYCQEHSNTLSMRIQWERDKSLLTERALYGRWVDLWDTL